ncbi:hypothetical protein BDN71DRAFT_1507025 [Pleurotus eryngii]|uniref:Uncharacterized protein n=1 Tax=Pleurotus eryngii TaxID=5323 RepID=A0A9P6DFW3_PLEER|nr:hypothetical protein BDN71DRAFT_1507025 [Pleurotus eryngii]
MVMGNNSVPATHSLPVHKSPVVHHNGASLRPSTQKPEKRHTSTSYNQTKKTWPSKTIIPANSGSNPSLSLVDQMILDLPTPNNIPNTDKLCSSIPADTCPSPSVSDIKLVNTPSSSSELTDVSEDINMNKAEDKPSASPTTKIPTVELVDLSISKDSTIAKCTK